ncbi:MAG: hypothetical protein F7C07_04300 [Desulfurococcales archaeon]|nr:hypothetical protein [Desulfurococcales archaeon]
MVIREQRPRVLSEILYMTLSIPIKPGSYHRFLPTIDFEKRIVEATVMYEYLKEVYRRGYELGRGSRSPRALELGKLLKEVYKRVMEEIEERPLAGLSAAAMLVSSIVGYSDAASKSVMDALPVAINVALYRGGPADAIEFIEGLEAVGHSELLGRLDEKGLGRSRLAVESRSLGDLFEALSDLDYGFKLNLRNYSEVLEYYRIASRAGSVTQALLEVYIEALSRSLGVKARREDSMRDLAKLDKSLRLRGIVMDKLLGITYASVALAFVEGRIGKLFP